MTTQSMPTEPAPVRSVQPKPVEGLPSPVQFPNADVIIFDGNCRFCHATVRQLRRMDGRHRLAFLSLHDPYVAATYPDLSHAQLMDKMHLIDARGHRYAGVGAIRYLTRRLPKLWLLAPLMHVPGSLRFWQWGYAWIARNRYRIASRRDPEPCKDGACELHYGPPSDNRTVE